MKSKSKRCFMSGFRLSRRNGFCRCKAAVSKRRVFSFIMGAFAFAPNFMKTVEKNVLVLHSAEQMFELVDRAEDYPKFLPWYSKTEIIERTDTELKARLYMDYMRVQQSFATHNHNIPGREIRMDLLEGPFKALHGTWKFIPLGDDACKIEFKLQYEFAGSLLSTLISPVFSHLSSTLVDAFVKEADRRYG